MSDGTQLVRYDAMCRAIAAARAVDEVKDIRDKARALEVYARQARNTEAEEQAREIRLRAERRAGQLLADREMAKPGGDMRPEHRSPRPTDAIETLSDIGISKQQSSDWQKLAAVPEEIFEQALAEPNPSTAAIITRHEVTERPPGLVMSNHKALWLWGCLRDFEREGLLDEAPGDLVAAMLEHMQASTLEIAPRVAAWLGRIRQ